MLKEIYSSLFAFKSLPKTSGAALKAALKKKIPDCVNILRLLYQFAVYGGADCREHNHYYLQHTFLISGEFTGRAYAHYQGGKFMTGPAVQKVLVSMCVIDKNNFFLVSCRRGNCKLN